MREVSLHELYVYNRMLWNYWSYFMIKGDIKRILYSLIQSACNLMSSFEQIIVFQLIFQWNHFFYFVYRSRSLRMSSTKSHVYCITRYIFIFIIYPCTLSELKENVRCICLCCLTNKQEVSTLLPPYHLNWCFKWKASPVFWGQQELEKKHNKEE